MNWVDAEARLSKVILECFPETPDDEAKRLGLTIYDAWKTAVSLQSIEGSNRTGAADIKSLQLAAKHLRRCVSKPEACRMAWRRTAHTLGFAPCGARATRNPACSHYRGCDSRRQYS